MNLYSQLFDLGIDSAFIDAIEFAGGVPSPPSAPSASSGASVSSSGVAKLPSTPGQPRMPKITAPKTPKLPNAAKGPGVTLPTGVHIPQPSAPHVAIQVHAPATTPIAKQTTSSQSSTGQMPQTAGQSPTQSVAQKPIGKTSVKKYPMVNNDAASLGIGVDRVISSMQNAAASVSSSVKQLPPEQLKAMDYYSLAKTQGQVWTPLAMVGGSNGLKYFNLPDSAYLTEGAKQFGMSADQLRNGLRAYMGGDQRYKSYNAIYNQLQNQVNQDKYYKTIAKSMRRAGSGINKVGSAKWKQYKDQIANDPEMVRQQQLMRQAES